MTIALPLRRIDLHHRRPKFGDTPPTIVPANAACITGPPQYLNLPEIHPAVITTKNTIREHGAHCLSYLKFAQQKP